MKNSLKSLLAVLFLLIFINNSLLADNLQNGMAALKKNDLASALKHFSLSVQENKSDPSRLYYLGLTLKNMGEKVRSQRAFEAALKLNPPGDLKDKINNELRNLSRSKPTINLSVSPKISRAQNTSGPNYLQHVVPDQQVCRWDIKKMPLKVYISSTNNEGYQAEFRNSIIRAMRSWQSSTGNKVSFTIVTNPEKADIKVGWKEKFEGHKIGENPFFAIKGDILRSDVNLSTIMPDGRPKTAEEIYSVSLHEFGHVLGIQGHSPYKEDVMYYSLNQNNYNGQLTQRDINTMKLLYSMEADVSNKLPLDMASSKEFYRNQLEAEKYILSKDYKNALLYYLKAIKIYNKDFTTHFNAGVCLINLNDYRGAIEEFMTAKLLNPNDTMTRYNLAVAQVNYVNSLDPSLRPKEISNYKDALENLQSIQSKSDKPPQTDQFIEMIQTSLSQFQ